MSEITLSRTGKAQLDPWSIIFFENDDAFATSCGGNSAGESSGSGTEDEHRELQSI